MLVDFKLSPEHQAGAQRSDPQKQGWASCFSLLCPSRFAHTRFGWVPAVWCLH